MNDPWDVKSVRQSNQYVSCMKINGVPLLPPVLSKECRKEMEYYKLLAKEVEKRISILKPYVGNEWDSSDDKTDAPELPECEHTDVTSSEEFEPNYNISVDKVTAVTTETSLELNNVDLEFPKPHASTEKYKSITSNVTVKTTEASSVDSPNIHIDLSLSINDGRSAVIKQNVAQNCELPERDCEYPTKQKGAERHSNTIKDVADFDFVDRNIDSFADIPFPPDGPSSLSSKSFTGSLYDIHAESTKESHLAPQLLRQRSYTVLTPSPQLLAHLEVQSINTGVEMSAISMSESLSNLHSPNKKRRSWDLETAKVKWSSMALELKSANVVSNIKTSNGSVSHVTGSVTRKSPQTSPPARPHSVAPDKTRRVSSNIKTPTPKSDPIPKPKNVQSPIKNIVSKQSVAKEVSANPSRQIVKESVSPTDQKKVTSNSPKLMSQSRELAATKNTLPLFSNSDDPAFRVRELYEKIQNQQLIQMANLVEKQKREQMLLQQVFEEQNTILFKQLKTICPTSSIEVKMAWGDKTEDVNRGPVSLSQLIDNSNQKSPERSTPHSPVANTLTETNTYLSQCDNMLKKSRDITGSLKRQQIVTKSNRSLNGPVQRPNLNKTRSNSPINRNTSRKLNYDTSGSERDFEPILTDRTNDTLADLNVTFPSDSDEVQAGHNTSSRHSREISVKQSVASSSGSQCRYTDSAIRCLEDSIQHSINSMSAGRTVKPGILYRQPTAQQREAATKIVAHAKGWLVRRLMKTERVQATVQTIRDALLCALQMHQDREGIRGADVDLHRRLIQQITAACYSLHDTFIASTPADRCAIIAADRGRRRSIASRQPAPRSIRHTDIMSQSHSGAFPTRSKRSPSASLMTQSNYETFNGEKSAVSRRYMPSPQRRPWR